MIPIDAKLDKIVECVETNDLNDIGVISDTKLLLPDDGKDSVLQADSSKDESLRMSDVFKLPYIFKILTISVILVYGKVY